MDLEVDAIKRLTIQALVSDDELVQRLVLKGGNALWLVHGQHARASFDIDFSMADAFEPERLTDVEERIRYHLERTFAQVEHVVFDVTLRAQPQVVSADLEPFWGGYSLEFKLISRQLSLKLNEQLEEMRRQAIPSRPGGRARFEIDISRHEYVEGKAATEIDHYTVFVYTPAMIVSEKLRAICQQSVEYVRFVRGHRASRARDFFDIYNTVGRFDIDLTTDDGLRLIRNMFGAKSVPLRLLLQVESDRALHRQSWPAVQSTVNPLITLRSFDSYFDYVLEMCNELARCIGVSPRGT